MLVRALHPWGSDVRLQPGQSVSGRSFVVGRAPPEGTVARVKARHSSGDYVLPFACRRSGGRWLNQRTGKPIEVEVVGWRAIGL